jgi:hypothetical protein
MSAFLVILTLEGRINQHRLVCSTVFNLALISLAALAFLIMQPGFSIPLFIMFLFLKYFP